MAVEVDEVESDDEDGSDYEGEVEDLYSLPERNSSLLELVEVQ